MTGQLLWLYMIIQCPFMWKLMMSESFCFRTHVGAAFSGILFGYLTCPTMQLLNNAFSPEDSRKQEGVALLQRQTNPCKSLLIFAVSILILSCLVFFYGPQLELLEMEDFAYLE